MEIGGTTTSSMPSPPASHPFLRPAVPAATHAPLIGAGSNAGQGTTYYRPLASLGDGSEPTTPGSGGIASSPTSPVPQHLGSAGGGSTGGGSGAGTRPESRTSVARSSQRPPSRARSPKPANGYTDLTNVNGNGAAAPHSTSPRKLSRWEEKVQGDLAGWRGGHG